MLPIKHHEAGGVCYRSRVLGSVGTRGPVCIWLPPQPLLIRPRAEDMLAKPFSKRESMFIMPIMGKYCFEGQNPAL
jgi:hypothetical protein